MSTIWSQTPHSPATTTLPFPWKWISWKPHVHQQNISKHARLQLTSVQQVFIFSNRAWAGRFAGLSSQCLKWPCFVIIRPANHRHRAPLPNILIQFGRASKGSFPSHDLHWFITFVFIFTLFIGVNVSFTSPIIMPEVNDVTRCTWFTNVNRSWATLAKHADSYLWLAEDSPIVVLSAEKHKLHWALHSTTSQPPLWIVPL